MNTRGSENEDAEFSLPFEREFVLGLSPAPLAARTAFPQIALTPYKQLLSTPPSSQEWNLFYFCF